MNQKQKKVYGALDFNFGKSRLENCSETQFKK
jgi:hypothetical protein